MSVYQRKERFEEFVMEEFLGSGASAEVWRVRDTYDQVLALKIFAPGVGLDNIGRAIFREEFERTFELDHPNILRALRYGDHDNKPFIVMPLSQQGSLMKLLRERMFERKQAKQSFETIFTEEELAAIIYDVSNALIFLKEHGILHRDIKPDNILIMEGEDGGRYKVTDFGISTKIRKTIHRQTHQKINTDSGLTPAYAAPEIYRGDISYQSDIFSLGVSLYELASGETPLVPSGVGIGLAMLNGAELPPLQGDFTNRFKQLLDLTMHADPQKRCTAEDLRDTSNYFLDHGCWPEIKISPQYKVDHEDAAKDEDAFFFDSSIHVPYRVESADSETTYQTEPTDYQGDQSENGTGGDQTSSSNRYTPHSDAESNLREELGSQRPDEDMLTSDQEGGSRRPKKVRMFAFGAVVSICILGLLGWIGFRHLNTDNQDWLAKYNQSGDLPNAISALSDLCDDGKQLHYCRQRDTFQHLLQIGEDFSIFQNGRARYRDKTSKLYGYFDQNGRQIIPSNYLESGGFNQYGFAYAAKKIKTTDGDEKRWGMIDTNGVEVIPFQYRALNLDTHFVILDGRDTLYYKKITIN
jgi:serine/threonine protein kinase